MAEDQQKHLPAAVSVFAGALIVAWLGVLVWLGGWHLKDDDLPWTRLTFLLNSLEAVVFAAAGALFGTQVQKVATDTEKNRADKAERVVTKAKDFALLYKRSLSDLPSIFETQGLSLAKKDEKLSAHSQMDKLADDILLEK